MVDGVDASFVVDGEDCLVVAFFAEGGDFGAEGASEVAEGACEVESAEWVDVHGGGCDLAAGCGGADAESAEFGPGFDGCGEDGVLVSGGGGVGAEGVCPFFGLADVPAPWLPSGVAECGVHGDGEAGGGGAALLAGQVAHGWCVQPFSAVVVAPLVRSTGRTPKWASISVQERQGGA